MRSSQIDVIQSEADGEINKAVAELFDRFKGLMASELLETPESLLFGSSDFNDGDYTPNFFEHIANYREQLEKSGNIVRVDNKFKSFCTFKPGTPQTSTLQISVAEYHQELSNIKFCEIDHEYRQIITYGYFLIRFQLKNGDKFSFFVREDEDNEIKNRLELIINNVPDDNMESICRKRVRINCEPMEKSYWGKDGHHGKDWDVNDKHQAFYEAIVDPTILEMFEKHILSMAEGKKPLTILDIGGGKGRLAEKLICLAQKNRVYLNYIMLEPDEYQCNIAAEKLSNLKKKYGSKFICKTTIMISSLEDTIYNGFYEKNIAKVHGVISSGGPLNTNVVSYETAQLNLKVIGDILVPNGKLIASGLTHIMVTKEDFLHDGFNVLNTIKRIENVDEEIRNQRRFIQSYVCEKPSSWNPKLFKNQESEKNPAPKVQSSDRCRLM